MRRAAVAFAADYGPLAAALRGDETAMQEVATRMFRACAREGLAIVINPDSPVWDGDEND